ncbi:hypothetical protein SAMN04489761_3029 [Tenacibaculum sp. MAR_2009_124]|uniref:hypothetical protein n=1 Tax=Tenacibaculum sp. MAR_2009_124 TaxID=1250059 RepID=UPI00089B8C95|nr:hypothetical protein [Tenacibaculum sp. MAR_2009_124]SEC45136.1 hypothetical protein SAMN04489761_3029 [Tenacibaculum sp. MAR_2009_124]
MDIVKLISNKVKEIADDGKLSEIVEKHTIDCIDSIIKDVFRWNGEGKKAIEEAVKSKLDLPLEEINVSRYNKAISNIIEHNLNNSALEIAKNDIKEAIDKVTGVLDKKEFTLSEIIEKYIDSIDKSYDGDMEDEYGELSFHVESSGSFTRIYFDQKSDKNFWECENSIGLHNSKIFTAKSNGVDFSPFTISPFNGFESYLFQLYANNVTVIIDESKVETEYYREDCN